jgi:hypothetical protein
MKKLFSILTALLVIGFWANTSAQVKISGDLQVRPRYDMKDYGNYGGVKNDMYYMLRAQINVNANIGDGWYTKIRLGHYNYAGYAFTNGLMLSGTFIPNPTVNFNLACFGYKGKNFGIGGGIYPLNGIANPMLDLHFYPSAPLDIPFAIKQLNNVVGFRGWVNLGPGKLNVSSVLTGNGFYQEDAAGNVVEDTHDSYVLGFDYAMKVAGFSIQPVFLYTYANDKNAAPMTYGVNVATPKFGGFGFGVSAGMTSNSADSTQEYSGMLARFKVTGKVGPGTVILWYDYAKTTYKYTGSPDVDENFGYIWAAYKIGLSKHVIAMPRVRIYSDKIDNSKDYRRTKAEILFIAKF